MPPSEAEIRAACQAWPEGKDTDARTRIVAALAAAETVRGDRERALVEALRKARRELNAIKASDGAPVNIQWGPDGPMQTFTVTPEYWRGLIEECDAALAVHDTPSEEETGCST